MLLCESNSSKNDKDPLHYLHGNLMLSLYLILFLSDNKRSMITVESVQMPNKDIKRKFSIKVLLFVFVLFVAALTFAIFWFG